jgi:hypothetical protein
MGVVLGEVVDVAVGGVLVVVDVVVGVVVVVVAMVEVGHSESDSTQQLTRIL